MSTSDLNFEAHVSYMQIIICTLLGNYPLDMQFSLLLCIILVFLVQLWAKCSKAFKCSFKFWQADIRMYYSFHITVVSAGLNGNNDMLMLEFLWTSCELFLLVRHSSLPTAGILLQESVTYCLGHLWYKCAWLFVLLLKFCVNNHLCLV